MAINWISGSVRICTIIRAHDSLESYGMEPDSICVLINKAIDDDKVYELLKLWLEARSKFDRMDLIVCLYKVLEKYSKDT